MKRPLLALLFGACAGLAAASCDVSTCSSFWQPFDLSGMSDSFAFHIEVAPGAADEIFASLSGTISSAGPAACTVAFYRFTEEPRREDLPELHAGDEAPETLPGGGTLIVQHGLPAPDARRYVVQIGGNAGLRLDDDANPVSSLDVWLVGVTCPDAELVTSVQVSVTPCKDGNATPVLESDPVEQVW